MTGVVHTFTVIHIGMDGPEESPYAVIVAEVDGGLRTARAEGDLSWLAIGAPVVLAGGQATPG